MKRQPSRQIAAVADCFLSASAAWAVIQPPPPTPWGDPTFHSEIMFYDTDGNAGMGWRGFGLLDGPGSVEYFDGIQEQPFYSASGIGGHLVTTAGALDEMGAYYLRVRHPGLPCYSFYGHFGDVFPDPIEPGYGYWPVFVIPASFSAMGLPDEPDSRVSSDGPGTSVLAQLWIADSDTSPSLAMMGGLLPDAASREVRLRVDYLEGCSLHALGSQEKTIALRNPDYWGQNKGIKFQWNEGTSEHNWQQSNIEGPVRMTVAMDGYTTSTLELDLSMGRIYTWNVLMTADGGPNAGDVPGMLLPTSGIMEAGAAQELLGECTNASTLTVATDPNDDGIRDAADMVRLKVEE